MSSQLIRPSEWPRQAVATDPIKQLFDRVFEGSLFPRASTDDSSIVTSQRAPRVDIKEEAHRFVLYADIPGVEMDAIEVQMDKGMLTIKGERKAEVEQNTEQFTRIERSYGAFASPCPIAPTRKASRPPGAMAYCRSSFRNVLKPRRAASG